VATVRTKTSISIDELINDTVVSGRVTEEGVLLFETRGGAEIFGGNIPLWDGPLNAWPVGSIFMNETPTDPATLLGGGTWIPWGVGRMPISVDPDDIDFDTAGKTGGEKTHQLSVTELPTHHHVMDHDHPDINRTIRWAENAAASGTNTRVTDVGSTTGVSGTNSGSMPINTPMFTGNTGDTGGGAAHNNMPPHIAVYMWKRTA